MCNIALSVAKVVEIAGDQRKRDAVFIVLGTLNQDVIIGQIVGQTIGGISDNTAISIMQMNPGQFYLGGVVVSIYPYNESKADNIARVAGYSANPIRHSASTRPGFMHYHNGYTFATSSVDTHLPHAFFGGIV